MPKKNAEPVAAEEPAGILAELPVDPHPDRGIKDPEEANAAQADNKPPKADADEFDTDDDEAVETGPGGDKPPTKAALRAQEKRRAMRPSREFDIKPRQRLVTITDQVSPVAANRVVLFDADGHPNVFLRRGPKPITARRMAIAPVHERQLNHEGWVVADLPDQSVAHGDKAAG